MSKRKHNLIIVSVLFVLLLGVLFLLISMPAAPKETQSKENNNESLSKIIDMSDKEISNIEIKNLSGQYNIKPINKDDKNIYVLSDENEDKTSQSMTSVLVDTLVNLTPTQVVTESADDLSEYGLNANRAEITIYFNNGNKITLKLGDDAPLAKGAYMRVNDESKVYLISETDKEIFINEKTFYEEKE